MPDLETSPSPPLQGLERLNHRLQQGSFPLPISLLKATSQGKRALPLLPLIQNSGSGRLTPLHKAAGEGHTDVVQVLIESGAQLNYKTDNGQTPLHLAAKIGSAEICKLLIEAGANPKLIDKHNTTPRGIAIQEGHTEVAELFPLDRFSRKKENDSVVHSDLYNAVANGHTEVVETLIVEMRAERDKYFDGYYGWDMDKVGVEDAKANTLLHVAAANGHEEVAKLLLQAGASVTAKNNDNQTPVDLAYGQGHESLAQRLERVPPLLEAAAAGNVAQVETLLAAGVYVNAHRLPGRPLGPTPLHHAAEKGYALRWPGSSLRLGPTSMPASRRMFTTLPCIWPPTLVMQQCSSSSSKLGPVSINGLRTAASRYSWPRTTRAGSQNQSVC